MNKSVKRKPGRPPGRKAPRRPVISARAPEALYLELREAAAAAGRTLGEELVWRAEKAGEWAKTFGEQQKWQAELRAENDEIRRGNLEAVLRRGNWKHVAGAAFGSPNWISPENHNYQESGFFDPAAEAQQQGRAAQLNEHLEAALEKVVNRAVKAALAEKEQSR